LIQEAGKRPTPAQLLSHPVVVEYLSIATQKKEIDRLREEIKQLKKDNEKSMQGNKVWGGIFFFFFFCVCVIAFLLSSIGLL
jgi:hypothetical protein